MEEVDGIIIHTLKSIGCDIEDDVHNLHQFSTELIVEAAARCLRVINNELDVPHKLPPSMSARFRVGSCLATAVQDLGYRGDIGYQTFLYSNDADIRRVFIFLVEKLPKDSTHAVEEALRGSALLHRAIAAELQRRLQLPWTPSYCKRKGVCWRGSPPKWHREGASGMHSFRACSLALPRGLHDVTKPVPKDVRAYYSKDMPPLCNQPPHHHQVAPSVLEANAIAVTAQQEWESEWNALGLPSRLSPEEYKSRKRQKLVQRVTESVRQGVKEAQSAGQSGAQDFASLVAGLGDRAAAAGAGGRGKGSRFTHAEKLQFAQDEDKTAAQLGAGEGPRMDTEEELQQKREDELQSLRDDLAQLSSRLEAMQLDVKKFTASKQQMDDQLSSRETKNKEKEEAYRVKKRTIDLLPDAENNIEKLQTLVDSSAQRLVTLANQWEKHRAPLIEKYRQLQEESESRMSESEKRLEELKELRDLMKEVATEAKGKEELHKQLIQEFERMTKDVNRSAYTRRILEIVTNIKKQKEEIDKILIDTKAIQKEINSLSGKLDRTFTVTDELIFKDARRNESVRKAYKFLAALHENCSSVIKIVEETGVIMREIRDLEDQIDQESKKRVLSNLEQITTDYQQMKHENVSLMAQAKQQQRS